MPDQEQLDDFLEALERCGSPVRNPVLREARNGTRQASFIIARLTISQPNARASWQAEQHCDDDHEHRRPAARQFHLVNISLLHLDPDLWDYVIVHELLHITIPNHGKFWKALMSAHLGDWEAAELRLRHHTASP
jgi:hypothetical protein